MSNQTVVTTFEEFKMFILAPGIGPSDVKVKARAEDNTLLLRITEPKKVSKALLDNVELATGEHVINITHLSGVDTKDMYSAEHAKVSVKNGIIMIVAPASDDITDVEVK